MLIFLINCVRILRWEHVGLRYLPIEKDWEPKKALAECFKILDLRSLAVS